MENVTLKTLEQIQEEFKIKQQEIIAQTLKETKTEVYIDYSKEQEIEEKEHLLPEIPEEYISENDELPEEMVFEKPQPIKPKYRGARCVFTILIVLFFVLLGLGAGLYFYGDKIPLDFVHLITRYVKQFPIYIGGGLLLCLATSIVFRAIFSVKRKKAED